MRHDSSMLTLDEFLRETSAASATRDEAERHLSNLLSLRRRIGAERAGADSGTTGRERRRDWATVSSPHPDGPDGGASWRTLVEHTPAGRARILGALPGGSSTGSPVAAPLRSVPYTYTPLPVAGQDSFDTLVGQIRRIGALQDFMLSGIVEGESVAAATAGSSSEAATEEDTSVEGSRVGGGGGAGGDYGVGTGGEEAERNAVAALRVREARLRAMQTRIDLLASEFALLRNTRRELRWVGDIFFLASFVTICGHACNFFPEYSSLLTQKTGRSRSPLYPTDCLRSKHRRPRCYLFQHPRQYLLHLHPASCTHYHHHPHRNSLHCRHRPLRFCPSQRRCCCRCRL